MFCCRTMQAVVRRLERNGYTFEVVPASQTESLLPELRRVSDAWLESKHTREKHFYNFKGLRKYKEKFDPQWRPRYLASPGGMALPKVLGDLSSLIFGGLGGLVGK